MGKGRCIFCSAALKSAGTERLAYVIRLHWLSEPESCDITYFMKIAKDQTNNQTWDCARSIISLIFLSTDFLFRKRQ